MPNREIHLGIALIIFIPYAILAYKFSFLNYLIYGGSVFLGAIFPDIVDPWTSENRYDHRGIGHKRILIKPLWMISGVSLILSFFFPSFIILLFFCLGYLSHLYADSHQPYSWSKGLT